jgi:hypothetical protein
MKLLSPVYELAIVVAVVSFFSSLTLAQPTFLSITIGQKLDICGVPAGSSGIYTSTSQIPTTVRNLGILSICTNKGNNFFVRVGSSNGGELRTVPISSYKFDYQVNGVTATTPNALVGGTFAAPFKPPLQATPQILFTSPTLTGQDKCRNTGGCDIGIQWRIISPTSAPAGVYTDTIYYTITAN